MEEEVVKMPGDKIVAEFQEHTITFRVFNATETVAVKLIEIHKSLATLSLTGYCFDLCLQYMQNKQALGLPLEKE